MKCASCGLPLSPTSSSCPRCGKLAQGQHSGVIGQVPGAGTQRQATTGQRYSSINNASQQGTGIQQQEWNTPWNASQASFSQPSSYAQSPLAAAPVSQPAKTTDDYLGEPFFQPSPTSLPSTPESLARFQKVPLSPGFPQVPHTPPTSPISPISQTLPEQWTPQHAHSRNKAPIPFGFTVASLCVVTGGLILIFVYFLSFGVLAADNAALQSATTHAKRVPTVVLSLSPTTIPTTPTPTYPGQQYVDNVVMASAVITATAQPITVSNTFKVRQRMYVTFEVHTINHSGGGICLLWYINNKPLTSFAFAVTSSTSAYSYAFPTSAGAGYVEIYWSTLASCADPNKVLGQRTPFTVTV